MRLIITLFLFSAQVLASDNYKLSEGRKIFVGPSFKIWCSLTKAGKAKIGKKVSLKSGNLVLFPKSSGSGHLPTVVAKDFSKPEEINELFGNLKSYCKEELKELTEYIEPKLDGWIKDQVPLISFRTYDEVLWHFYDGRFKKDKLKNSCKIHRAYNVKKKWLLTYAELNKGCL